MAIETSEKLEQQVRESGTLIERLQECRDRIGKMCKEGRPPKMTIPVQWYDDDFFISVTLQDAIAAEQAHHAATESGLYNCEVCGLEKCIHPGICDDCTSPTDDKHARALAYLYKVMGK